MKKILLIIFLGIIGVVSVKGATTTMYYDYQIPNMYITRVQGSNIHNGAPFMLHKPDGTLVYCIEPFVIPIDGYYNIYNDYDSIFNLSREQINRINLIARYGYGYDNHTDIKWYGITQYLIWETIVDQVYFTDTYHGNYINAYEAEINELRQLVNNYNVLPKFKDMNMIITGEETIIEDSNNVLSNYEIVGKYKDWDLKIEDNKLIVKANTSRTNRIYFRKRDNSLNYELYYNPNSQNLILPGRIDDLEANVFIWASKGSLRIKKHDLETDTSQVNNSFLGAVYGVYNYLTDELVGIITLDEKGEGKIDSIPMFRYNVKEIQAPYGYKLDNTVYNVVVDESNEDALLDVYEEPIKKRIVLHKKYGSQLTNRYFDEEGAIYGLYDLDNNLIKEYQSDEYGMIYMDIPFGKYLLKQIKTKDGYTLSEDIPLDIYDDIEEHYEQYNEEIIKKGNIHLTKKGSDNKLLNDVEFELYAAKDIVSLDGYVYHHKGELIDTVTTINGKLDYNDLYYGDYYLKEIRTNDGYKLLDKEYSFTVDSDNKDLTIINDKIIDFNEIVHVPNTGVNDIDYFETFSVLLILFSYCLGLYIYQRITKKETNLF